MSLDPTPDQLQERRDPERLDSWKEIAAYLRRGVTTVQRWERDEGLPVHRHDHAKRGSVYAFKSELDAWRSSRRGMLSREAGDSAATPVDGGASAESGRHDRRRFITIPAIAAIAILALGAATVMLRSALGSDSALPRPRLLWEGEFPRLSPDGRQVVYMSRRSLFVRSIDSDRARPLLNNSVPGERNLYPAWSRDGRHVAFLREVRRWVHVLTVVDVATRHERPLVQVYGHNLDWMPDGSAIAVPDRHPQEDPFSIFLISVHTGERLKRVTAPPAGYFGDIACAVSPDGQRVVVARYNTLQDGDLYVVPINGGEGIRLTDDGKPIEGFDWTPDGRAVVFSSYRDGNLNLWKVAADGSQAPVRMPNTDPGARHPTLASAGAQSPPRLVYTHEPLDHDVWRLDLSQTGMTPQVVASSPWRDEQPALSPDGRKVAFSSGRSGSQEIWIADADGQVRQITVRDGAQALSPRWSPDGSRLAFASVSHRERDIYIVGADGGTLQRLTYESSDEDNPSWSSDGAWVYFRTNRSGRSQIWKVRASGGAPLPVIVSEASEARESPDGRRLYFVKGRLTMGLWSVPTAGGAETLVLPGAQEGFWDVTSAGIYFLPRNIPSGAPHPLQFFTPSTGTVSERATFRPRGHLWSGFSASANGESVVWTDLVVEKPFLMLLDPLH